jgi:hypothetical protein
MGLGEREPEDGGKEVTLAGRSRPRQEVSSTIDVGGAKNDPEDGSDSTEVEEAKHDPEDGTDRTEVEEAKNDPEDGTDTPEVEEAKHDPGDDSDMLEVGGASRREVEDEGYCEVIDFFSKTKALPRERAGIGSGATRIEVCKEDVRVKDRVGKRVCGVGEEDGEERACEGTVGGVERRSVESGMGSVGARLE